MTTVPNNSKGIRLNRFGATATGLTLIGGQITAEEPQAPV